MTMSPSMRLESLRQVMREQKVAACVVPTSDPHLSEYLPDRWQGREWLSGFTGSAGTLVVCQGAAGLWTDSRYWEQAEAELRGTGIDLMRAGQAGVPAPQAWVAARLPKGAAVAVDGQVLSVQAWRQWQEACAGAGLLLAIEADLPGRVWADRPHAPAGTVTEHTPPWACRSRQQNLQALRADMQRQQAQWHLISALDDLAWLFNLRGNDIPYNPVFLAHALVGQDTARLFVDSAKLDAALRETLQAEGIALEPYENIAQALAALPDGEKLLFDPARVTVGLLNAAAQVGKVESINPAHLLKSRKNPAEIANVRRTMEEDGAALCEFFAWFEEAQGRERITELTIDERLTAARARRPGFVSPSFGTIAAWQANGAMPHYHATEAAHAVIEGDGLLLIDSGGQYLGGTTDITRVVPVGQVTAEQKRDYTAVLKGMITLSQAVFPAGLPAYALDAFARGPVWRLGADYGHGTGHGVGYFMNVHEGPQSISWRGTANPHAVMQEGMITSNEPGLYRPGRWGIRIENLILARAHESTEFGDFLRFETLTLCPIDIRCIDIAMLSQEDVAWLNQYHAQVRERLSPRVEGAARAWLEHHTRPIGGS
ncbi:MAG: aminopeptidase P family protein [Alcaligenaceae bacterium]|nr:aminopeptidase P family protein [Alcaligenaceae bacterium]